MLPTYLIITALFVAFLLLIRRTYRSRDKNGDGTGRYNLFSPGDSGEFAVARQLRKLPDKYLVINDLLFNRGSARTTQIDHVVVSPYGIFVIETKNISGHVYGSAHAQKWTRYLRTWWYGVERTDELSFNNPILQNEAHIQALKKVLSPFGPVDMVSIIAFSPKAVLFVQADQAHVIYWSQVRRFIRQYKSPILSVDAANRIYDYLRAINIKDKDARLQHARQVSLNRNR